MSFTNVLDNARQYFQGVLPSSSAPSREPCQDNPSAGGAFNREASTRNPIGRDATRVGGGGGEVSDRDHVNNSLSHPPQQYYQQSAPHLPPQGHTPAHPNSNNASAADIARWSNNNKLKTHRSPAAAYPQYNNVEPVVQGGTKPATSYNNISYCNTPKQTYPFNYTSAYDTKHVNSYLPHPGEEGESLPQAANPYVYPGRPPMTQGQAYSDGKSSSQAFSNTSAPQQLMRSSSSGQQEGRSVASSRQQYDREVLVSNNRTQQYYSNHSTTTSDPPSAQHYRTSVLQKSQTNSSAIEPQAFNPTPSAAMNHRNLHPASQGNPMEYGSSAQQQQHYVGGGSGSRTKPSTKVSQSYHHVQPSQTRQQQHPSLHHHHYTHHPPSATEGPPQSSSGVGANNAGAYKNVGETPKLSQQYVNSIKEQMQHYYATPTSSSTTTIVNNMPNSSSSSSQNYSNSQQSLNQQQFQQQQQHMYHQPQAPQQAQQQEQRYPTMNTPSWFNVNTQQYRHTQQQQQQQQKSPKSQQSRVPQESSQTKAPHRLAHHEVPHHLVAPYQGATHHGVPQGLPQGTFASQEELQLAKSRLAAAPQQLNLQHQHHASLQRPKAPYQGQKQRSGVRRDSPLDLSVRTIRRSADSTLDDEGSSNHATRPSDVLYRVPNPLPDTTNHHVPTPPRLHSSTPPTLLQMRAPHHRTPSTTMTPPRRTPDTSAVAALPNFRPSFRRSLGPDETTSSGRKEESGGSVDPAMLASLQQQYKQHQPMHHQEMVPQQAVVGSHYQRAPRPSAADKRVLNILRNSLEVRNPGLQKMSSQQSSADASMSSYRLQVPRAMESASPQFLREANQLSEASMRSCAPPTNMHGLLPPHGLSTGVPTYPPNYSANLSHRTTAMPPSLMTHNLPSVSHSYTHSLPSTPPNLTTPQHSHIVSVINHTSPTTTTPSTGQSAELDGLAAFLAARIRTKAELKQCGDLQQTPMLSQAGFCPQPPSPSIQAGRPNHLRPPDKISELGGFPPCSCEGPCHCKPRRAAPVASRKASETRSSTETSVFDFPDSDSEMVAPASVGDLRRHRKPPVANELLQVPAPAAEAPVPQVTVPSIDEEPEDPMWGSLCDSFVQKMTARASKPPRPGQHSFTAARKRKMAQLERAQQEEEEAKQAKLEPKIEIKSEAKAEAVPVSKEEMELISSCLKAASDCEKLLEISNATVVKVETIKKESDSDSSDSIKTLQKPARKIVVESSSSSDQSSDDDEDVSLAARKQRLVDLPLSSSSTSDSSSESDWSDDVGKSVVERLRPRSTRSQKSKNNIRTRLRSHRGREPSPVKKTRRPGRPRRMVESPSSPDRCSTRRSTSPLPGRSCRRKSSSPIPVRASRRKGSYSPASTRMQRNKSNSPASEDPSKRKSKSPIFERSARKISKSPVPVFRKSSNPATNQRPLKRKSKSPDNSKQKTLAIDRSARQKSKSPMEERSLAQKSKSPEQENASRKELAQNQRSSRRKSRSPVLTDSGFYPGWESELVKFKQSLRMPSNLISVHSRPSSGPPTPTKRRRGCNNSPMSCISDPGLSGNLRTLAVKRCLKNMDQSDASLSRGSKVIRDVECSDSSASLSDRRRKTVKKDRSVLLAKLADKLKGRAGLRSCKRKVEPDVVNSRNSICRDSEDDAKSRSSPGRGLRRRRRSARLSGTMERRLLRSAALQRSNRALLNSKRHLRRRDLRASETGRVVSAIVGTKPGKKGPRGRRKLRSSGFDYLRKKKKKKDGTETKKNGGQPMRQTAESVEDLQNEIRGWVVNKGLGETILHRAARMGHTDVAAYCLETAAMDPSPRDNAGYTPLHEACSRGHLPIARLLLLYGAHPDDSAQGGIRPLHEAADCGDVEVLRLLLSYGADPLLATYCGQTPLALAATSEAHNLLEGHLADVQGRPASPWSLGPMWSVDIVERGDWTGFDVLADAPSPSISSSDEDPLSMISDYELSPPLLNGFIHTSTPPAFWLPGEADPYYLLPELIQALGHGLDWLKKSVKGDVDIKELTLTQFLEQAKSCHALAADWKPDKDLVHASSASLISLVRIDDKITKLLQQNSRKSR